MFPLNMDSRWEFHPGSLADVQDTAARPQPPLLEAEPTERGGRQSSQTRGPSTPQTDPVGTAECCFGPPLAVHTRGPLSEREYIVPTKHSCTCLQGYCARERGESGVLPCAPMGLPPPGESVEPALPKLSFSIMGCYWGSYCSNASGPGISRKGHIWNSLVTSYLKVLGKLERREVLISFLATKGRFKNLE